MVRVSVLSVDGSRLLHKFYEAVKKWLLEHVHFVIYFVEIFYFQKIIFMAKTYRKVAKITSNVCSNVCSRCHVSNNNKLIALSGTNNIVLNIYVEYTAIYSAQ